MTDLEKIAQETQEAATHWAEHQDRLTWEAVVDLYQRLADLTRIVAALAPAEERAEEG